MHETPPPQLQPETLANSCHTIEVHQNASEVSTQSETTRSSRTMLMIDLLLVPTRQHNDISCSTTKKLYGACWCQRRHQNELCCPLFTSQELRCHLSNPKATQRRSLDVDHFGRFGLKNTHQRTLHLTPKIDLLVKCVNLSKTATKNL